MKILLIFTQKMTLKNNLIGKIEHFGSVKHCKILVFLLSVGERNYIPFLKILVFYKNMCLNFLFITLLLASIHSNFFVFIGNMNEYIICFSYSKLLAFIDISVCELFIHYLIFCKY